MSTDRQTVENQRPDVEQLAVARELEIVAVYEENASAVKKRPAFEAMLADARRGVFRTLIVWRLDRFGRSMQGNVNAVLELDRLGVEVVSVCEPWLDCGGPARSLLLAVFSWVAEEERRVLVERTRAGLVRAVRKGKRLGRPPTVAPFQLANAAQDVARGLSVREAARLHGVGRESLRRALARAATKTPSPNASQDADPL